MCSVLSGTAMMHTHAQCAAHTHTAAPHALPCPLPRPPAWTTKTPTRARAAPDYAIDPDNASILVAGACAPRAISAPHASTKSTLRALPCHVQPLLTTFTRRVRHHAAQAVAASP